MEPETNFYKHSKMKCGSQDSANLNRSSPDHHLNRSSPDHRLNRSSPDHRLNRSSPVYTPSPPFYGLNQSGITTPPQRSRSTSVERRPYEFISPLVPINSSLWTPPSKDPLTGSFNTLVDIHPDYRHQTLVKMKDERASILAENKREMEEHKSLQDRVEMLQMRIKNLERDGNANLGHRSSIGQLAQVEQEKERLETALVSRFGTPAEIHQRYAARCQRVLQLDTSMQQLINTSCSPGPPRSDVATRSSQNAMPLGGWMVDSGSPRPAVSDTDSVMSFSSSHNRPITATALFSSSQDTRNAAFDLPRPSSADDVGHRGQGHSSPSRSTSSASGDLRRPMTTTPLLPVPQNRDHSPTVEYDDVMDPLEAQQREANIIQLLRQLQAYCAKLTGQSDYFENVKLHPGPAVAALMKLSFDSSHRQIICGLGGLQLIAEVLRVEHEVLGHSTEQYDLTLRRYVCMTLTNLTFGIGVNKSQVCAMQSALGALVAQLESHNEELRQVSAAVLRNLSWRADSASKSALRAVGTPILLTQAALAATKESTLKSMLSALWNLSAHCTENKADICSVEGALRFLVSTLLYKSPSKTLAIIENGGGILRNISSVIALREDYRQLLRDTNCLPILLRHLRSPSLTIVSNACGTLWNLSARCTQDQETLIDLGAISMLRCLVHSKHKMISTGSAAALKNLLGARSASGGLGLTPATGLPSLQMRKQRALERDVAEMLCDEISGVPPSSSSDIINHSDQSQDRRYIHMSDGCDVSSRLGPNITSSDNTQSNSSYMHTHDRPPAGSPCSLQSSLTHKDECRRQEITHKDECRRQEDEDEIGEGEARLYCTEGTPYLSEAPSVTDLVMDQHQEDGSPGGDRGMRKMSEPPRFGGHDFSDNLSDSSERPMDYSCRYQEVEDMMMHENQVGTAATRNATATAPRPQTVPVQQSLTSSGDRPRTYAVEGTPVNSASRASSLSSIFEVDERNLESPSTSTSFNFPSELYQMYPQGPGQYRVLRPPSHQALERIEERCSSEGREGDPERSSETGTKTPGGTKTVTFDEGGPSYSPPRRPSAPEALEEETPLILSRCSSSYQSLESLEEASLHSDVISEYSRRTSELVSPSDLPDSPADSPPPPTQLAKHNKLSLLTDIPITHDETKYFGSSLEMDSRQEMDSRRDKSLSPSSSSSDNDSSDSAIDPQAILQQCINSAMPPPLQQLAPQGGIRNSETPIRLQLNPPPGPLPNPPPGPLLNLPPGPLPNPPPGPLPNLFHNAVSNDGQYFDVTQDMKTSTPRPSTCNRDSLVAGGSDTSSVNEEESCDLLSEVIQSAMPKRMPPSGCSSSVGNSSGVAVTSPLGVKNYQPPITTRHKMVLSHLRQPGSSSSPSNSNSLDGGDSLRIFAMEDTPQWGLSTQGSSLSDLTIDSLPGLIPPHKPAPKLPMRTSSIAGPGETQESPSGPPSVSNSGSGEGKLTTESSASGDAKIQASSASSCDQHPGLLQSEAPHVYNTEDTPAHLSRNSPVSHSPPAPQYRRPQAIGGGEVSDKSSLSSLSIDSEGFERSLLQECISSAMPLPKVRSSSQATAKDVSESTSNPRTSKSTQSPPLLISSSPSISASEQILTTQASITASPSVKESSKRHHHKSSSSTPCKEKHHNHHRKEKSSTPTSSPPLTQSTGSNIISSSSMQPSRSLSNQPSLSSLLKPVNPALSLGVPSTPQVSLGVPLNPQLVTQKDPSISCPSTPALTKCQLTTSLADPLAHQRHRNPSSTSSRDLHSTQLPFTASQLTMYSVVGSLAQRQLYTPMGAHSGGAVSMPTTPRQSRSALANLFHSSGASKASPPSSLSKMSRSTSWFKSKSSSKRATDQMSSGGLTRSVSLPRQTDAMMVNQNKDITSRIRKPPDPPGAWAAWTSRLRKGKSSSSLGAECHLNLSVVVQTGAPPEDSLASSPPTSNKKYASNSDAVHFLGVGFGDDGLEPGAPKSKWFKSSTGRAGSAPPANDLARDSQDSLDVDWSGDDTSLEIDAAYCIRDPAHRSSSLSWDTSEDEDVDSVTQLSDNIDSVTQFSNNIDSVTQLSNNIDSVTKLSDNIDSVTQFSNNIDSVTQLSNNINSVTQHSNNIDSVTQHAQFSNNIDSVTQHAQFSDIIDSVTQFSYDIDSVTQDTQFSYDNDLTKQSTGLQENIDSLSQRKHLQKEIEVVLRSSSLIEKRGYASIDDDNQTSCTTLSNRLSVILESDLISIPSSLINERVSSGDSERSVSTMAGAEESEIEEMSEDRTAMQESLSSGDEVEDLPRENVNSNDVIISENNPRVPCYREIAEEDLPDYNDIPCAVSPPPLPTLDEQEPPVRRPKIVKPNLNPGTTPVVIRGARKSFTGRRQTTSSGAIVKTAPSPNAPTKVTKPCPYTPTTTSKTQFSKTKLKTQSSTTSFATKPKTQSSTSSPSIKPKTQSSTTSPATKPKTQPSTSSPSTKPKTQSSTTSPATKPKTQPSTASPSTKPKTQCLTTTSNGLPKPPTSSVSPLTKSSKLRQPSTLTSSAIPKASPSSSKIASPLDTHRTPSIPIFSNQKPTTSNPSNHLVQAKAKTQPVNLIKPSKTAGQSSLKKQNGEVRKPKQEQSVSTDTSKSVSTDTSKLPTTIRPPAGQRTTSSPSSSHLASTPRSTTPFTQPFTNRTPAIQRPTAKVVATPSYNPESSTSHNANNSQRIPESSTSHNANNSQRIPSRMQPFTSSSAITKPTKSKDVPLSPEDIETSGVWIVRQDLFPSTSGPPSSKPQTAVLPFFRSLSTSSDNSNNEIDKQEPRHPVDFNQLKI